MGKIDKAGMEAQRPLGFGVVSLTTGVPLARDAPSVVWFCLGLGVCYLVWFCVNFCVFGSHGGGIGAG